MKCESCSADVSPDLTHCEFCGSYVLRTAAIILEEPPPRDAPPPPQLSHSEILLQLKDSEQYQALLLSHAIDEYPIPAPLYLLFRNCSVASVTFGTVAIVSAFYSITFAVLPAFATCCFVWMAFKSRKVINSFNASSAIPHPAIVIKMQTLSPGLNRAVTEAYATFELENGIEEKRQIWEPQFYNRLELNDAGFLICRDGIALDFHRVAI